MYLTLTILEVFLLLSLHVLPIESGKCMKTYEAGVLFEIKYLLTIIATSIKL